MTPPIVEGALTLTFPDDWFAVKWDECDFRRKMSHVGKAVDIAAYRRSSQDGRLLVIEIKDYPANPTRPVPGPAELANTCQLKVRDTLAQVLFASARWGRALDKDIDQLCRSYGSTERAIMVILLVEDANEPALEMLELQVELENAFKWLPTVAVTAATIEDINATLTEVVSVIRQV